jgi:hypothetical protein
MMSGFVFIYQTSSTRKGKDIFQIQMLLYHHCLQSFALSKWILSNISKMLIISSFVS